MTTNSVIEQLQSLSPNAIIELFELIIPGQPITYRFHAGTNSIRKAIKFGYDIDGIDISYEPWPISASGFTTTGDGQLPRPMLTISNVLGFITALALDHNDLIGAKIRRIRTFKKFINSTNFATGINPTEDVNAIFPVEFYLIERKVSENRIEVSFELSVPWDVQGTKLPKRQIVSNICNFTYRREGCGYAGPPVADVNDVFILDQELLDSGETDFLLPRDICGKRLASCRLRFNKAGTDSNGNQLSFVEVDERDNILRFGGFPGAGRIL